MKVLDDWNELQPSQIIAQSLTKAVDHLRDPLYRNGYILMVNSAATSGLGLLYWALAARCYRVETVGLNSAVLASMTFLSGICSLGLSGALQRFVPVSGKSTGRLVASAYLVSSISAGLAGLIFLFGVQWWAPALLPVRSRPDFIALFITGVLVFSVFSSQDSVLTGLRQPVWVALENSLFGIAKIGLLILFSTVFVQLGIFASWVIPALLTLVPVNLLIFLRFIPRQLSGDSSVAARTVVRFITGNSLGSIFYLTYTTLLPLLVANQAGVKASAYFYLPWMMITAVQLITNNMASSLTVEAATHPKQLSGYCYEVLMHLLRLLVPVMIAVEVLAGLILQLFGAEYAQESASLLRLMILACLPQAVIALYITYIRIQNHSSRIFLVQSLLCVLILGLSSLLLRTFGITGVGLAWLLGNTLVALLLLIQGMGSVLKEGRAADMGHG